MADQIATYTFLPWLRQGIASQIGVVDTMDVSSAGHRADVEISFTVNDDTITNRVQLIGPGDIIGINPSAVARTDPRPGATDFESNYLPAIEFLDADFAWRYTPAASTNEHRLRPWISLVVLTPDEFTRGRPGPLPSISVPNPTSFPQPGETWAWAHVHVSRDITDNGSRTPGEAVDALEDVVAANPDQAVCRVVCPRRLEPLTAYHALLIPTFETGRRAGLGIEPSEGDGLRSAWGDGQTDFPVYFEWSFGTGERGDFEFLVNLLEPREVDDRVGVRSVDVSHPDPVVAGLPDPVGLEGAIQKPGAVANPEQWPPDPPTQFVADLEATVNLQADLLEEPGPGGHPDPIVGPPLYGRWHAKASRLSVEEAGWPNELNGDPRLRMPAAFGTDVIKKHQERFMQRAWQQLGDVIDANDRIRKVQLATLAARRIFTRHLASLDVDQLLTTTQPVHARVLGSPVTVHELVRTSQLPHAATSSGFRKVTRPRGVIQRKAVPAAARRPAAFLGRLNDDRSDRRITAAPPKRAPEGQIALDDALQALVPVPRWILERSRWVVAALVILAVILSASAGLGPAITVGVLAVGVAIVSEFLRRRAAIADSLGESGLTAAAVAEIPLRPAFTITEPGSGRVSAGSGATDSGEAALFRSALTEVHSRFDAAVPAPPTRAPLAMTDAAAAVIAAIDPAFAVPKRALSLINIPATYGTLRPAATIAPVMAHPVFADAMYAPLADISADHLVPNLHLIPDDTVALMQTNRRFIEAYMLGLNHEMGRELLWRRYVTDQRGSYFRQFWDVSDVVNRDPSKTPQEVEEELRDLAPVHTWPPESALGTHETRPLPTGDEDNPRLVLVVKGRVLHRYPTTVVFAQRAEWATDELGNDVRRLDEGDPADTIREPVFKAAIEPDVTLLGFDLTADEAKGRRTRPENEPGWFVVFQQRPGEPRFGMDLLEAGEPLADLENWDDLLWQHIGVGPSEHVDLGAAQLEPSDQDDRQVVWGSNAADTAYILYQAPVMVAFHAGDMLP